MFNNKLQRGSLSATETERHLPIRRL